MLAILERSDAMINKSSAPTPHHDVAAFQAQAPRGVGAALAASQEYGRSRAFGRDHFCSNFLWSDSRLMLAPGIGESCWESLPPTLCLDALGGHLARRRGALLRHLRLPRLGHQARLFVHLDPLLARNRRDQLANRFERQIVRRLEMNATLPHVELLPRRLERRLQLLELTRTPKRAHQVERAVVLLRRERDVADRLLVVSVWIS